MSGSRFLQEFGRLVESVGPLDVLSVYSCDPNICLTPFLDLEEFNDTIMYPSIKELRISHPTMLRHEEECIV